MNIVLVVLCAFMAVAHAEDKFGENIRINRGEFQSVVDGYNLKIAAFKLTYEAYIDDFALREDLANASIIHNAEHSDLFTVFKTFVGQCIAKYRSNEEVEKSFNKCKLKANDQLELLLSDVVEVSNDLEQYTGRLFGNDSLNCGTDESVANTCVYNMILEANKFVESNQNLFEVKLQEAEGKAKFNSKWFDDCVFSIYIETIISCYSKPAAVKK